MQSIYKAPYLSIRWFLSMGINFLSLRISKFLYLPLSINRASNIPKTSPILLLLKIVIRVPAYFTSILHVSISYFSCNRLVSNGISLTRNCRTFSKSSVSGSKFTFSNLFWSNVLLAIKLIFVYHSNV